MDVSATCRTQQERLDIEEKYTSLQEEAQGKTKKLKKVWTMLMAAKSEVSVCSRQPLIPGKVEPIRVSWKKWLELALLSLARTVHKDLMKSGVSCTGVCCRAFPQGRLRVAVRASP